MQACCHSEGVAKRDGICPHYAEDGWRSGSVKARRLVKALTLNVHVHGAVTTSYSRTNREVTLVIFFSYEMQARMIYRSDLLINRCKRGVVQLGHTHQLHMRVNTRLAFIFMA